MRNQIKLETAYRHCMAITRNHYENFPVASRFIPKGFRKHIAAVYAFARTADDFADVEKDEVKLLQWREQLHQCVGGRPNHPVFLALSDTIEKFQLPVVWLDDLLTAFLMDLEKNRFRKFSDLLDYSRYSANPVGRIVLRIFGYQSEELMRYSDSITTALQLTNFWQDISVDITNNKIYIPTELFAEFHVDENQIVQQKYSSEFGRLLDFLVEQTKILYEAGEPLPGKVNGRLRWELKLTLAGGKKVLEKVAKNKELLLYCRPKLTKRDWAKQFIGLILRK